MEINFKWIGSATFVLSFDGIKIAVDPVLCKKGTIQDYFWFKSKRIEDPSYTDSDFKDVSIWLITHNHEDHLDDKGLAVMEEDAFVITNPNSVKKLKKKAFKNLTVLHRKEVKTITIKDYRITIEAIPAIHGVNPLSAFFSGKGNGYLITIEHGKKIPKRIYITGDTVYKKRVIYSVKGKTIDLMIPNMSAVKQNTWMMALTLSSKMLQKFITELQPKMVIPVHYNTFEHYSEPISEVINLNDNRIRIIPLDKKTTLKI